MLASATSLSVHPAYVELRRRRRQCCVGLSLLILIAYFGYVLLLAYAPSVLAQRVGETRFLTIGLLLGPALIVLAWGITGFYVRWANRHFDPLVEALARDARS